MITFLLSQAGEEIYSFKKLGSWTFKEVWGAYAYGGFLFASTQDGVKILNIYNLRDSVKGIQLVEFRTGTRPVGTAYYKGFFYVGVNAPSGPEIDVVSFTDGKVATSIPTGGRIVSLGISSNYLFVLTSLGLKFTTLQIQNLHKTSQIWFFPQVLPYQCTPLILTLSFLWERKG